MKIVHELRLFFVALQFLTRVPSPRWVGFEADWLNQSARWFALVGLLVGGVGAGVFWLASMVFAPTVAAGLAIAATVVLTGGFHEDGLADTFDALGGAVDRARALAIMKDSRIGSYGALALVVVIGLKAAALGAMQPALAVPALLLAHCASRAAAVVVIRVLPYAGDVDHAKAKPLARTVSAGGVAVALGCVAALCVVLLVQAPARLAWLAWLAASMALGTASAAWCLRWLRRRLGGYTGDTLGATQQITELTMLLAALAGSRWPG